MQAEFPIFVYRAYTLFICLVCPCLAAAQDPPLDEITPGEFATTAVSATGFPAALASFGEKLFTTAAFDGDWYSPTLHLGIHIDGLTGSATVSNSPQYKPGDVVLRLSSIKRGTRAQGSVTLPWFDGHHIHPSGEWFDIQGRITPSGRLLIIARNRFSPAFHWAMEHVMEGKPLTPAGCVGVTGGLDGFWYSPQLKYGLRICAGQGHLTMPPLGPWVLRPRQVLALSASPSPLRDGTLLSSNAPQRPGPVWAIRTGTGILMTEKPPGRSVWTWLPVGGQGPAGRLGGIAIVIDGIDLKLVSERLALSLVGIQSGSASPRAVDYLIKDTQVQAVLANVGDLIETITWTGDMTDARAVRAAIDTLKCRLVVLNGIQIDLIAHSYGTVIAYQALSELSRDTGAEVLRCGAPSGSYAVANFVTLGSPLGRPDLIDRLGGNIPAVSLPTKADLKLPTALHIRGTWINAYHADDPIGGRIDPDPPIRNFAFNSPLPENIVLSLFGQSVSVTPTSKWIAAHAYSYTGADALRAVWDELKRSHLEFDAAAGK